MPFRDEIRAAQPAPDASIRRWVWVLNDQLRNDHPLLTDGRREEIAAIFIECTARRAVHKQKQTFLLAAQRHFALRLAAQGHPVVYHYTGGDLSLGIDELREAMSLERISLVQPAEHDLRRALDARTFLDVIPNPFFVTPAVLYKRTFRGKSERTLEPFYRAARMQTKLLMDGRKPEGGKWNPEEVATESVGLPPLPPTFVSECDEITREVMAEVEERGGFGSLERFNWPVNHADATRWLEHVVTNLLPHFATYEELMHPDEPRLFHAFISPLLNVGLLSPLEVCERAEGAYRDGLVSLFSVERFVRNIIGWREFVRHVYEEFSEVYANTNALGADAPLPAWFATGDSGMTCVDTSLREVVDCGHSHHVTRLLVLSNIATLLGVDPHRLKEWFALAYVDAFDWAVTPNVLGAGTWADGGVLAGKPAMAPAREIKKRGPELCARCHFDPDELLGERACPFNALYWSFINRHRDAFANQPRMPSIAQQYDRFGPEKIAAIEAKADQLRQHFLRSVRDP